MKGDQVVVHMPATIHYEGDGFATVRGDGTLLHVVPDTFIQRTEAKHRDRT